MGSHGRELKGERPPNRWLLGQHRLRDAQEKTSTVLSATKYEGISGYVTQVKNNLIFKNKKSETTNCEHDETECCAHPEQGSEATRFLGEKKDGVSCLRSLLENAHSWKEPRTQSPNESHVPIFLLLACLNNLSSVFLERLKIN